MSFIPSGEKIIETKKCPLSGEEFFVTDKDLEFYDKISPVFGGKKYSIPSPKLSPDERWRRKLAFRNENYLYKRNCALTGREIISMYSPASTKIIYDHEVWWSDAWDIGQYRGKFDFSRPFFEQFQDFIAPIPVPGLYNSKNENSRFSNYIIGGKNAICHQSYTMAVKIFSIHDGYLNQKILSIVSSFIFQKNATDVSISKTVIIAVIG